jgi:SnoaL-like protein
VPTMKPTGEQLLSRVEIHDVLLRYLRGVDRRDMDLVRSAYHLDATQSNPYLSPGEDASARSLVELIESHAGGISMSMHFLGNVFFEFANDRLAVVESYVVAYQVHRQENGTEEFVETGFRYLDRFEKRSNEWKIAHRVLPLNFIRPITRAENAPLFKNPVMSTREKNDPLWDLRAAAGLD